MKIDEVRHIVSLGAGTMGQQIALQCAMHGYDVIVYDLSSDVLRDAAAKVRAYAEGLVEKKRLTPSASTEALSRITFTSKPEDAANANPV